MKRYMYFIDGEGKHVSYENVLKAFSQDRLIPFRVYEAIGEGEREEEIGRGRLQIKEIGRPSVFQMPLKLQPTEEGVLTMQGKVRSVGSSDDIVPGWYTLVSVVYMREASFDGISVPEGLIKE